MNQEAIGKFIAACRKEKNLTQMQLAEKLNITNRAVSKWETGKSCPDVSIMMKLCDILGITVNELLSAERISMENYPKKSRRKSNGIKTQKRSGSKKLIKNRAYMVGHRIIVKPPSFRCQLLFS